MRERFDVAILGAGASGLFAARWLEGLSVCLIDSNLEAGKKVRVSGGGRCNFTNEYVGTEHFVGEERFIQEALDRFGPKELLTWLEGEGLSYVKVKNHQYFCAKSSQELLAILLRSLQKQSFKKGERIQGIIKLPENRFKIMLSKGSIEATLVLVATGGMSYPLLGASGVGYEIAQALGHEVNPLKPALVGLTLQSSESWMKELSGISLPATLKVENHTLQGDMLFAHRGISGPLILDASLFWKKGSMEISFLPDPLRYLKGSKGFISSSLPLPRRFTKALLGALGIMDGPFDSLQSPLQATLLNALMAYTFAPAGNFGYSKAEVTLGGVSLGEIDPKTMESRLCSGVFWAGEVLDVTGRLGGYNLQWAFSSAYVAAQGIIQKLSLSPSKGISHGG